MSELTGRRPLLDLEAVKHPLLPAVLKPLFGPLLAVDRMNADYAVAQERYARPDAPANFYEMAVEVLGLKIEVSEEDLAKIPAEGPVVVVANHPFGGVDGIVLAALLLRRRSDARFLVNYLLGSVPEIRDTIFEIDPFARPGAKQRSLAGMKRTIRWLKEGGLVATFPAGMVSHFHLRERSVMDRNWDPGTARMIRHTEATVVPVFF